MHIRRNYLKIFAHINKNCKLYFASSRQPRKAFLPFYLLTFLPFYLFTFLPFYLFTFKNPFTFLPFYLFTFQCPMFHAAFLYLCLRENPEHDSERFPDGIPACRRNTNPETIPKHSRNNTERQTGAVF